MSLLRTLLASLLILVAGVFTLAAVTHNFQAFTTETSRRISVRASPRVIPVVELETATGDTVSLGELRGKWLLVDFVYANCATYCAELGREFARLQDTLATLIRDGKVEFLSISFDRANDGPEELAMYLHHSGSRGAGWTAARPLSQQSLDSLVNVFGVVAIPDGFGGYVHNAAIAVVDPSGRLVSIFDWDASAEAVTWLRAQLAG